MKLLFVVQNYNPSVGGTQMLFQNLAERCANDFGDDVTVITTNSYFGSDKKQFRKIETKFEIINNVKVFRFSFARFHLSFLRFAAKISHRLFRKVPGFVNKNIAGPWSPQLMKAIYKTDADVIFAGTSNYLYMQYPLSRERLTNPKPFVSQGAIHFAENRSIKVIADSLLKSIQQSDYYLANTNYEKERLVELGVDSEKIVVAGCAVNINAFSAGDRNYFRNKMQLSGEDILIGYIGRIESTKGIDILLHSFAECFLQDQNIYLVISGYQNPDYTVKVQTIMAGFDPSIKNHIHFIFDIGEDEKVDLFHALDIFVLPSANESFGIVFLEAWACKKPVIGTAIGAVRSVISVGEDGLLMEPGNSSNLAQKILFLARDPVIRNEMGMNGYNKAKKNYTWDVVTKKYRETFIKAIEKFAPNKNKNV